MTGTEHGSPTSKRVNLLCAGLLVMCCLGCSTQRQQSESYPVPLEPEAGLIDGRHHVVSPMKGVEEGVYFFDAGLSKLVLELRNGRFRYWFSSDARDAFEPAYPVTGKYLARGATIQLLHPTDTYLEDTWTFRKIDETTTLWRPLSIKAWHEQRGFDFYGVLYPTDRKAEEVWLRSRMKVGP